MLLPDRLHHLQHLLRILRRRRRPAKEIPNPLLFLICIWRIIAVRKGLAVEKVGHEDLVLVGGVGVSEDVGALDSLWAVAEDVVDDKYGGGG